MGEADYAVSNGELEHVFLKSTLSGFGISGTYRWSSRSLFTGMAASNTFYVIALASLCTIRLQCFQASAELGAIPSHDVMQRTKL